jgi:cytochrome c oxidase assembly factor CtaG
MSPSYPSFSGWDWEPSVVIGCAALLVAYGAALRFRFSKRAGFFVVGTYILFLALVSPLDMLADHYLLSAHMLQHILLMLVVPPLWLLGIPRDAAQNLLRWRIARSIERVLRAPVVAWTMGIGIIWFWHWPRLFDAALASEPIHIVEHLMLLVSAIIFWWPVLGPIEELRLDPLTDVIYVLAACAAQTALGIAIMFTRLGIYPVYAHSRHPSRIVSVIRDAWGFTPAVDREIGGLVMWVPSCVLYLALLLAAFARAYRTRNYDPFTASGVPPGTALASRDRPAAPKK